MNSEELANAYGPDLLPKRTYRNDNPYAGSDYYSDRAIGWEDRPKVPQNSYERVVEFMEAFGHPVYETPRLIEDEGWEKMRLGLIQEEFAELLDAAGYVESARWLRDVVLLKEREGDLIEIADALGDIEYVVNGAAAGYGIHLPDVVEEIHRSNMTKLGEDGKPIYRADGKVLKGPNYERPDIQGVLF